MSTVTALRALRGRRCVHHGPEARGARARRAATGGSGSPFCPARRGCCDCRPRRCAGQCRGELQLLIAGQQQACTWCQRRFPLHGVNIASGGALRWPGQGRDRARRNHDVEGGECQRFGGYREGRDRFDRCRAEHCRRGGPCPVTGAVGCGCNHAPRRRSRSARRRGQDRARRHPAAPDARSCANARSFPSSSVNGAWSSGC